MALLLTVCAVLSCVLSFPCGISGESDCCTNVTDVCSNKTHLDDVPLPSCLKLREVLQRNCSKQNCHHDYWNITLQYNRNVSNGGCNYTICFHMKCSSNYYVAKARVKDEIYMLEEFQIIAKKSSSMIGECAKLSSTKECYFKSQNVTVRFLGDGDNSSSTVAAVATLSERDVKKVKKHSKNAGDTFFFGDKGHVVFAVQEGENSSKNVLTMMEFNHLYPLAYIENSIRVMNVSAMCAFYDTTDKAWDPSVCKTHTEISTATIECTCEHNSAFAVIFAVNSMQLDSTLKTVSFAFEVASIAALLVTCTLLILYRRKLRNFDRVLVQISFCISLAMTHIFILLSEIAISNNTFCQAVIIISHYFLVSTATLMVMEGGIMLTKVLFPNFGESSRAGRRRVIGFIMAWIVPMVYAGVCAGIGIENGSYGNYQKEVGRFEVCWITDSFNLVVIIPVAVAIAINVIIILRLGILVASLSRRAEDFKPSNERNTNPIKHARKAFKAIIILLPILGIPWAIGFLVNTSYPANLVFASIHSVVNGCQGIFIFLHYVAFNSDMKACIRRSWESTKSELASFTPVIHFTSNRTDSTTTIKLD